MQLLAVKPFDRFLSGWQHWQATPKPLAILGGGAAGVELALAWPESAAACRCSAPATYSMVCPPGCACGRWAICASVPCESAKTARSAALKTTACSAAMSRSGAANACSGQRRQAFAWPAHSGLGCDERGFVLIAPTLQSYTHPDPFRRGRLRQPARRAQERGLRGAPGPGAGRQPECGPARLCRSNATARNGKAWRCWPPAMAARCWTGTVTAPAATAMAAGRIGSIRALSSAIVFSGVNRTHGQKQG